MDYSLQGSSVHGIVQARILEWVAILFSRGSSWSRDQTRVSHIAGRFFIVWATTLIPAGKFSLPWRYYLSSTCSLQLTYYSPLSTPTTLIASLLCFHSILKLPMLALTMFCNFLFLHLFPLLDQIPLKQGTCIYLCIFCHNAGYIWNLSECLLN